MVRELLEQFYILKEFHVMVGKQQSVGFKTLGF
jgi:hypothetical protein